MYVLHIGNKNYSSWSLRPWVLMKTLGIEFEERQHIFPADRPSYPEFKAFSPSGLVPVLEDGELRIWDSLGVVGYLAEKHATVWPSDVAARAWARSAASEMHSGFSALRNQCGMNVGIRCKTPEIDAALRRDIDRLDEMWGEGLSRFGGPFLAGAAFTAVDAFYCPVAFRVQTYSLPVSPRSREYVDRLLALSSMRDWYEAGIKEESREPGHEHDTTETHALIADYRAKPRR